MREKRHDSAEKVLGRVKWVKGESSAPEEGRKKGKMERSSEKISEGVHLSPAAGMEGRGKALTAGGFEATRGEGSNAITYLHLLWRREGGGWEKGGAVRTSWRASFGKKGPDAGQGPFSQRQRSKREERGRAGKFRIKTMQTKKRIEARAAWWGGGCLTTTLQRTRKDYEEEKAASETT